MDYEESVEQLVKLFLIFIRTMSAHMGDCSKGANGILFYLHSIHDGATPGELKEYFHIGSGGMANALKDLEDKGLVMRTNNGEDKRIVTVNITDKGTNLAHELFMKAKSNMKLLLETIGEDDTRALVRVVNQMIELAESNAFDK